MGEHYFRCYSIKDNFWLFEDLELRSADFPDFLKLIQINDPQFYVVTQKTGGHDRNERDIYEGDFIEYQDATYRVDPGPQGFIFKRLTGKLWFEIDLYESTIIGNIHEDGWLNLKELIGEEFI